MNINVDLSGLVSCIIFLFYRSYSSLKRTELSLKLGWNYNSYNILVKVKCMRRWELLMACFQVMILKYFRGSYQGWASVPFPKNHRMFSTVPIPNNELIGYFRYYSNFVIKKNPPTNNIRANYNTYNN